MIHGVIFGVVIFGVVIFDIVIFCVVIFGVVIFGVVSPASQPADKSKVAAPNPNGWWRP